MKKFLAALFLVNVLFIINASAAIKLPSIFCDNMVLQRDTKVPIWGLGEPGAKIVVLFNGQRKETKADKDGNWKVFLDPMPGTPAPNTIRITDKITTKYINEVVVGDVWVVCGGPNVSLPLSKINVEENVSSKYLGIRLFKVGSDEERKLDKNIIDQWMSAKPKSTKNFSALGFYFAQIIYSKFKVPVGIIQISDNSPKVESWINSATFNSIPEFTPIKNEWDENIAKYPRRSINYLREMRKWEKLKEEGELDLPEKPVPPKGEDHKDRPGSLFKRYTSEIIPFKIRGVIFYQNDENPAYPQLTELLLKTMVKDWRKAWNMPEMKFYYFQAPSVKADNKVDFTALREAQEKLSKDLPEAKMVVTADIKSESGITQNKKEEARRLALLAEEEVYKVNDEPVICAGPVLKSMKVVDDKVELTFDNVSEEGSGFAVKGPIKGFAVAGKNGKYYPAVATITPKTNIIVLSCKKVEEPVSVRYNWSNDTKGNLYNKEGLPAPAFRTDKPKAKAAKKAK